jgi:hypothetical protein
MVFLDHLLNMGKWRVITLSGFSKQHLILSCLKNTIPRTADCCTGAPAAILKMTTTMLFANCSSLLLERAVLIVMLKLNKGTVLQV